MDSALRARALQHAWLVRMLLQNALNAQLTPFLMLQIRPSASPQKPQSPALLGSTKQLMDSALRALALQPALPVRMLLGNALNAHLTLLLMLQDQLTASPQRPQSPAQPANTRQLLEFALRVQDLQPVWHVRI